MSRRHRLPFDGRATAPHPIEVEIWAARARKEAEERAEVERQQKGAQEAGTAPPDHEEAPA